MHIFRIISVTILILVSVSISVFGILILNKTVSDYINAKDPECYPYVCEMKSVYLYSGCYTIVYYYSDSCIFNGTNCNPITFRDCDECGWYCICCYSMSDKSCP